jgi:hypothetical protein
LAAIATQSGRLSWRVRVITIVAVVAAHVVLLAMLVLQRQTRARSLESASLVWLALTDEPAKDLSVTPAAPAAENVATSAAIASRPQPPDDREKRAQSREPSTQAGVLPDAQPAIPGTTTTSIDWYGTLDVSVAATIAAANDRVRRDRAFEPKRTPGLAEGPRWVRPPPHFRWSRSRTQRIERGEDGTTIVWLNDRCVLVNFVLPFCAVGEIPAHGDLFKDLKHAAEFGDWNDDSAERRADTDLLQDFP